MGSTTLKNLHDMRTMISGLRSSTESRSSGTAGEVAACDVLREEKVN